MKRNLLLIIASIVLVVSFFAGHSDAVCPEDPNDNGECDTMYVEIFPPDQDAYLDPPPFLVRYPIYVTHDLPDPEVDSIGSFVIPLCYTSSNPSANCDLPTEWNGTGGLWWDKSIFRHLVDGSDTTRNWMLSLAEELTGKEWDTRILDISNEHFWLAMFPSGSPDQKFWEGSRVLLATMTFELEDTTTICVDSCFWPPTSRLSFSRSDAVIYRPRHFLPVCQGIGLPVTWMECPFGDVRNINGTYQTGSFSAWCEGAVVTQVEYEPDLSWHPGVTDVQVIYTVPPPASYVEGYVSYTVADHCQSGGYVYLDVFNSVINGPVDECNIEISLVNNPPVLSLPDSFRALAENFTMALWVSATDPDEDAVTIQLEEYWYEPDSLQPPVNPPYYDGGNPGLLTWAPAEADTGLWIFQFSAADACDEAVTHQIAIQVGMPFCGDSQGDGNVDVSDFIYLIHYLFKQGPAPDPLCIGDVNCDGLVNTGDLVFLLNFYYRFGPAPCFDCCP
jgi:hypothetical protein